MSNFKWKQRESSKECFDVAKKQGYSDLLSNVLSKRYDDPDTLTKCLSPTLTSMDNPALLKDVAIAAKRIKKAIDNQEVIAIETDHDADGVTSHAVLFEAIHRYFGHPKEKIKSYIGHRLKEGYGLSQSLAERILADKDKPTLIITADNGSSDEPRIAFLREHGIETIVTDHHEIPSTGVPKSAVAVVSPTQDGCEYPDPKIAGCMVACLLMVETRKLIAKQGKKIPSMIGVFDFVALGTVADCVSMSSSVNNRLVVNKGLEMMNKFTRPCWRSMRMYLSDANKEIKAEDLAFSIAPRLNARGRLDEAMAGVHFLLAETDNEAREYAKLLDQENERRKEIEKKLKDTAIEIAKKDVDDKLSITVFLEDGHPGVHGIVSSRITEKFGRPSVMISPKQGDPSTVSASGRGIPGFHVRDALQWVSDNNPGMLEKFGGHVGAAGMSFARKDVEKFAVEFEKAAAQQLTSLQVGPVINSDGHVNLEDISMSMLWDLNKLEPFGREFDYPIFESSLKVLNVSRIGNGTHLRLALSQDGNQINGIWFNACEAEGRLPIAKGEEYDFLFAVTENVYRGNSTIQLRVEDVRDTPSMDMSENVNPGGG